MADASDNDCDYFTDVATREKELKKLNEEIDMKLGNLDDNNILPKGHYETSTYDEESYPEFQDLLSIDNLTKDLDICQGNLKDRESRKQNTRKQNALFENNENFNGTEEIPNLEDGLHSLLLDDDIDDIDFIDEYNKNEFPSSRSGKRKSAFSNKRNNPTTTTKPNLNSNNSSSSSSHKKTIQHLQKVRIQSLSSQLKEAIEHKSQLSKSNNEYKTKLSKLQETNRKLESQVNQFQSNITKKSNKVKDTQKEIDDLRCENTTLKKEISNLRTILKECESKSFANETKLKRAIESTEKFKKMVMNTKSKQQDDECSFHQERKDYESQIKDLAKQRDTLVTGFKKQMQLISLLKRQKVHLEASRMLDFTEKEFMSALDWKELSGPTTSLKQK